MRRRARPSREARRRQRAGADNHRNRRHAHKKLLAWGFHPEVIKVDERTGRVYRFYTQKYPDARGRLVCAL